MTLKEWKQGLAASDPRPTRVENLLDELLDELSALGVEDVPFAGHVHERLEAIKGELRGDQSQPPTKAENLADELIDLVRPKS